ncbi:DNA polymerase [Onchocerca flexuosa]|uniref:DNA polymerase n=1 Tax=Onchocerca flexuosa TaxID=387005 RepID=A0A238BR10_9BILA|nr:DNA polymerase [Onchocerca flexuosa]
MALRMSKRTTRPAPSLAKAKRNRLIEDEPSVFVTQLASLTPSDGGSSRTPINQFETNRAWARPPLPAELHTNELEIDFQVVDVDYYMNIENNVVIRLFGVTAGQNSVCVQVHGFLPYFYVLLESSFDEKQLEYAKKYLNDIVKAQVPANIGIPKNVENLIVNLDIVHGASIYEYKKDLKQKFLKVYVRSPKLLNLCRRIFTNGVNLRKGGQIESLSCFETNIDFEIRFMTDHGLVGCAWVTLPSKKYQIIIGKEMISRCQFECSINNTDLVIHSPESSPKWSTIAPLRILSFDIECTNRQGIFPEAHTDAVIQIANMVKIEGENEPFIRNCFVINETASVIGSEIIVSKSEEELLSKWAEFVRVVDPDIITGYNIQNFDFPYIVERARALKIENRATMLGRIPSSLSKVREMPLSSKQIGNRTNKVTNVEGRVVFDVIQVILRDYKLRSYSLNSVSYHFLCEQKEDVDYSMIADLQNGNAFTRRRLAIYCMKDAYLPLKLLQKLMSIINYIEMARVTGVPLDYLLSRGQQIKVMSQILRKAKSMHFFLPVIDVIQADDTYEGATVIDPIRGFYNTPIATLDFASLYPSIMIAHNLCYTTLIRGSNTAYDLSDSDFEVTPSNNRFVKSNIRRGLLPQVLEDLLNARKQAKNDLKNEQDPFRRMVLNGRQLALKISANSVYGFTGASIGKLPCLEISQSVTAYGRQMIDLTKNAVEEIYKEGYLNGKCPCNAKVIYGDTDSVMVKFGVKDVKTAMELGLHAATEVSKKFTPPIKLEFEKVYSPFLLINKKRYAGLYFTRPEKHDKIDCKGLETVRRDNCPLVSKVLSTCLEKMLLDGDVTGALEHAKKVISDLLCNRIDISELIITKELTRSSNAYAAKQAHVVLAERMRERDSGSAPRLGDRVPYVIVAKGQKIPAYEKAEDPIYVLQNNIPIDTAYYLENQLAKPLARIFEPILGDKAESVLTTGVHTLVRTVVQSKKSGLSQFFQKTERCLSCKSSLPKGVSDATCTHCKPNEGKIYITHLALMNAIENRFARLWTECQNCSGTMNEEVLCSARDCPIFYMREKVRYDLAEQMKSLQRFYLSTW